VTDEGLASIEYFPQLTSLDLSYTLISDEGLVHLKRCRNLERLNLTETETTDDGLAHLKDLKNITWLDLPKTKVTDEGLKIVARFGKLTWLNLAFTKVTNEGMMLLKDLYALESLRVGYTGVTEEGVQELQKALPKLDIRGARKEGEGRREERNAGVRLVSIFQPSKWGFDGLLSPPFYSLTVLASVSLSALVLAIYVSYRVRARGGGKSIGTGGDSSHK
jgi:hypothetical protein